MNPSDFPSLLNDKVMKERSRLLILCYLMKADNNCAVFMSLQKALDLTRGNLSVQVQVLRDAGYVDVSKAFRDNKPQTTICITKQGILAVRKHLADMETIIQSLENTGK